jgi:hypothetical protein
MSPFAGLRLLFIAGLALLATNLDARADKRVALVVGNSQYQSVARLPNPSKDADAVAQLLKNAGFEVVSLQQDVGNLDFKRAIRRFEELATDSDIALVYYAGHGIELGGVNYMIPVDAKLASDLDAPDEAIPLDRIVEAVEPARRLRLVILDACRDNPFVVKMKRQRLSANRSVSAGLGKVEPTGTGTLIAYAAKAGSTADDGSGNHSPFTQALLNNLTTVGLDIRLAFGRVRDEVMRATRDRQEPFVYGSLGGATVSLVDATTPVTVAPNDPNAEARRDYEFFERAGTKAAWDAFLKLHSSGPYSDLARAQLAKLADGEAAKRVGTPKPGPAQQPAVVAAASPPMRPDPATSATPAGPAPGEVVWMLQTELKRVGCYSGAISGDWSATSRRAIDAFNRNAGTKLDSRAASLEAVDAVRDLQRRVCPLECGRGMRADGDQCVRITCDAGFALGDNGACERIKERVRSASPPPPHRNAPERVEPKRQESHPPRAAGGAGRTASGSSPQVACDRFSCQPVKKGCSVRTTIFREETQQNVVCN